MHNLYCAKCAGIIAERQDDGSIRIAHAHREITVLSGTVITTCGQYVNKHGAKWGACGARNYLDTRVVDACLSSSRSGPMVKQVPLTGDPVEPA